MSSAAALSCFEKVRAIGRKALSQSARPAVPQRRQPRLAQTKVRFGFAGRSLWHEFDARRAGPPMKGIVPIEPIMAAEIKFLGRYERGAIRNGVLLAIGDDAMPAPALGPWSCDSDAVVIAFDARP